MAAAAPCSSASGTQLHVYTAVDFAAREVATVGNVAHDMFTWKHEVRCRRCNVSFEAKKIARNTGFFMFNHVWLFLISSWFFSCKAFFNCWEEASIFINFLAFLHRVFRISLVSAIEAHTVHRSLFFNPNCASCAFVSPQELLSNEMTVESTFRIRSLPTVQQIPKFRRMSSFVFQHGVFINSDVGNNFAAAFRS